MIWSLNTGEVTRVPAHLRIVNEQQMLERNRGFIGFGVPEEDRINKNGNTTYKQFDKFKELSNSGDIIYLYKNKVGYIARGIYTGEYFEPQFSDEKARGWPQDEIQIHMGIIWTRFEMPKKPSADKVPRCTTLKLLTESPE